MITETPITLLERVLALMSDHGYLITFLATTLENIFLVGSFTPGDTIVAVAAFTAASEETLNVFAVWAVSFLGTCTGTTASFVLGVRGGRAFLERIAGRNRKLHDTLDAAEAYFERHGTKAVFLARFVAVFKNITPVLAGVSRMRVAVFAGWTAAGAAAYTSLMVAVGWLLGDRFEVGLRVLGALGWMGFVIVFGGILAAWWGRRRLAARRIAKLGAEYAAAHPEGHAPGEPDQS